MYPRHALTPAATDREAQHRDRDRRESRLLCGLMIALGFNVLAWSMPTPSIAGLSFAVLCFGLALKEHRRARAESQREVARAGETHGLEVEEAARGSEAIRKA